MVHWDLSCSIPLCCTNPNLVPVLVPIPVNIIYHRRRYTGVSRVRFLCVVLILTLSLSLSLSLLITSIITDGTLGSLVFDSSVLEEEMRILYGHNNHINHNSNNNNNNSSSKNSNGNRAITANNNSNNSKNTNSDSKAAASSLASRRVRPRHGDDGNDDDDDGGGDDDVMVDGDSNGCEGGGEGDDGSCMQVDRDCGTLGDGDDGRVDTDNRSIGGVVAVAVSGGQGSKADNNNKAGTNNKGDNSKKGEGGNNNKGFLRLNDRDSEQIIVNVRKRKNKSARYSDGSPVTPIKPSNQMLSTTSHLLIFELYFFGSTNTSPLTLLLFSIIALSFNLKDAGAEAIEITTYQLTPLTHLLFFIIVLQP